LTCYMVFKSTKLRLVMKDGENWKWTVFGQVIGVNDVVSDFTTLSLIPTNNPFFLFWVSLTSLLCSVASFSCLVILFEDQPFSCPSFFQTISLSPAFASA
jgi:hypothetical protein